MPYISDTGFMPFAPLEIWQALSLFGVFMVWSFIWKGWALWRAAENKHKPWFIVLLLVNTLGILEILYIFVWGKKQEEK